MFGKLRSANVKTDTVEVTNLYARDPLNHKGESNYWKVEEVHNFKSGQAESSMTSILKSLIYIRNKQRQGTNSLRISGLLTDGEGVSQTSLVQRCILMIHFLTLVRSNWDS